MHVAEKRERPPSRPRLFDSLGSALPLLTLFVWLCLIYGWEAWGSSTPWLISDEFERAQLSRAVARTGHEALRSVPHSFDTLYVYFIAPVWWIHGTNNAYGVAKAIGLTTMTAVVFPTYLLARMLVSKPWALFAAAGAAMIPALAYSSMLLVEPLAYPFTALCFFVLAKAFVTRRRGWIAGAVAVCLLAPELRSQFVVVVAGAVLAVVLFAFTGGRARRLRRNWSRWDWAGFLLLALCLVSAGDVFLAHHYAVWQLATESHKGRMLTDGFAAAGALTIGLGVLPAIAGLSALARTPDEPASPERRAFVSIAAAMFVVFGLYTAAKSAYVSTLGLTELTERNLIYLAPLLFVGTALALERRRLLPVAVAAATVFVLCLVATTPYHLGDTFFFDAPGLSLLQRWSRDIGLTNGGARTLLVVLALASGALLAFASRLRRPRAVLVLPAVAALVLAWNVYGEVSFAQASHDYGNHALDGLPRPLDWIDRAVPSGAQVAYLGQSLNDANTILQLEFWNRSVRQVWSLDGTAPGPGATVTPNLVSPDGRLDPEPVGRYMVGDFGVSFAGDVVARKTHWAGRPLTWKLYRLSSPLRLRQSLEGVYWDAWGRPVTALNQFSFPDDRPRTIDVRVTRANGGGPLPATVVVRVGSIALGRTVLDGQAVTKPVLGKVLMTKRLHVQRDLEHVFRFEAPKPPFRVETSVTPLPQAPASAFAPGVGPRNLAAQVYYAVTAR